MTNLDDILKEIRTLRQENIAIYAELAALAPDAFRLGWQVRRPGDHDVTMAIVESAARASPGKARALIEKVSKIDARASALGSLLAGSLSREKKAILIPGGGVLHTFAVKEAQALGLEVIVTDRDPNCPCSKIPGVEFHAIDCYDTESHEALSTKLKDRLIGAFCGGADTHVQVAAAAAVIGSRWVSVETAMKCKSKLHSRYALREAGVPSPAFAAKAPAIFKPNHGSGSRGVVRQMEGDLIDPAGGHWEEILEGPEQSVEIFLSPGLAPVWVNIVDRHFAWDNNQPLEVGHTNPSRLSRETQAKIYELAEQAARAVGADCGFFKCDTILTKDGPKVLECCPRLSGGWDSQLSTPLSSGMNLLCIGIQYACGLPVDPWKFKNLKDRRSVTVIHRPHLATAAALSGVTASPPFREVIAQTLSASRTRSSPAVGARRGPEHRTEGQIDPFGQPPRLPPP